MENYSLSDVAAVTRNNDGGLFGNNGDWLAYIIIFALIFGGRGFGFGGNGNGGGEPVTEAGLCNAMNFNNLENAVGRLSDANQNQFTLLSNGLCNLGYETLGNFKDVVAQLSSCCCNIERAIDRVDYNGAMNTNAINTNTNAGIQKILDYLCQTNTQNLQSRIQSLELEKALAGVVRYPSGFTYTAGNSPFCNPCGNGQML